MNLADYLSELLGQHEEVSVPGLGYFVRERVNGYYNDKEGRFYPPYHRVKFIQDPKNDDTFAQYVADKKNISLASSKYFAEKFVAKLREQALAGKYLFADLGLFYTEHEQLMFKPNDKIVDDPAFYGLPVISVNKQGQTVNEQFARPAFSNPAVTPTSAPDPRPVEAVVEEPYYEEEVERRRGLSIWMIILIAVVVIALAVFGVYKFYPQLIDKITGKADTSTTVYRHETPADTTKKTAAAPAQVDSARKTAPVTASAATAADTAKQPHFEIIAGSFRRITSANAEIKRLKAKGVEAVISTDAPGPLLKINVGTFKTEAEATAAMSVLVKAGKIAPYPKSDVITINP
ncbi:MAG TPA: SPOR domain-containing protein [Mucilaginibacter sp.]